MSGSYWGKVDGSKKIVTGIRWVSTPSHGGIVVTAKAAAKLLSPAAREFGVVWGKKKDLCYEEDCLAAIVLYDLGIDRSENVIKSLSGWNPEYLISVGVAPVEPQYQGYLNRQESYRLREAKSPNLIVFAKQGATRDQIIVGCADGSQHIVTDSSYNSGRTPNLLSDCELVK